ncbi:hypothetical protein D9M73_288450 [compost metagenome]
MRPVLKMPPLQEDSAAVITTKLMMPAAVLMPRLSKVITKGLPWEPISFHG